MKHESLKSVFLFLCPSKLCVLCCCAAPVRIPFPLCMVGSELQLSCYVYCANVCMSHLQDTRQILKLSNFHNMIKQKLQIALHFFYISCLLYLRPQCFGSPFSLNHTDTISLTLLFPCHMPGIQCENVKSTLLCKFILYSCAP